MKKKITAIIFLIFLFSASSFSLMMKNTTLSDALTQSAYIVGVTCLKNVNDNTERFTYTYTTFRVDFVVFGDFKIRDEFTIKQLGGYKIDQSFYAPWFKSFGENERVILCLDLKKDMTGYVIRDNGVIRYKNDKDGNIIISSEILKSLPDDLRPHFDIALEGFKSIVTNLKKKEVK